jgi:hypothetical protein
MAAFSNRQVAFDISEVVGLSSDLYTQKYVTDLYNYSSIIPIKI